MNALFSSEISTPALNPQDAFQADNTSCPSSGVYLIGITTVVGLPISERCTGGHASPGAHDTLSRWDLIAG